MTDADLAALRRWAESMGDPWSGHDQAADAVLTLIEAHERVTAAVDAYLAFEDDHVEGPVVDDSYVRGPVCASCERYWPCPVEELRRGVRGA